MSVLARGNKLPKKGKELPARRKRRERANEYAAVISRALRGELGRGRSIKAIMRWTGAGERTVKGWVAGSYGPRGEHLVHLLKSSDLSFEAVLELADRKRIATRRGLEALKHQLDTLSNMLATTLT
jgi:hypothetical protein